MIDRNQFNRKDWQQEFERLFGLKLDLNLKSSGRYSIKLYDLTDTAQSKPLQELTFEINGEKNKIKDILFINRYNQPVGSKNFKIQLTTDCGKQLSIYPVYNKCYIEGWHEVWTFQLSKLS